MLNLESLNQAYQKVRRDLMNEQVPGRHWIGELSTSALSTSTAVSALSVIRREAKANPEQASRLPVTLSEIETLIAGGLRYITTHQNPDGGWGDTDKSYSNISTTMLALAAMELAGAKSTNLDLFKKGEAYVESKGGIPGLRKRYGVDKTFAVPILSNTAIAGRVSWREVSSLPFEAATVPQSWYRFMQLPVVSYAIPALVAIGQAKFFHDPPWNPISRLVRTLSVSRSLKVLERMQPASGGYLEAIPLTSFVMMGLASTGRAFHPVTLNGLRFVKESVRRDGSWPIDTNLATWTTTLSVNALSRLDAASSNSKVNRDLLDEATLDWILSCQHRERHPFTGAEPGGWGWTDLSGAVPDADDTPGALLALANWKSDPTVWASLSKAKQDQILDAVRLGVRWLLKLQNRDKGWPTFCRGWGKLPFDRSGSDLTAHALRAIHAWKKDLPEIPVERAIRTGLEYLRKTQRADGSWLPLWFGNQDTHDDENPIYGSTKVLMAYRDLDLLTDPAAVRSIEWIRSVQNPDGGWGGGNSRVESSSSGKISSVEETALALEVLLDSEASDFDNPNIQRGLSWLLEAVERDFYRETSPIGFYFAKLWYHETLYPMIFTASALRRACERYCPNLGK